MYDTCELIACAMYIPMFIHTYVYIRTKQEQTTRTNMISLFLYIHTSQKKWYTLREQRKAYENEFIRFQVN